MKGIILNDCGSLFCKLIKVVVLFILGGCVYVLVEKLFRGYSHISMFLLGGVDFVLIGMLNESGKLGVSIIAESFVGALIITASELITGYFLNIRLGLGVWDYSDLPFNFLGQISLYYSLLWIPVSFLAIILDDLLRFVLFGEEIPSYFWKKKRGRLNFLI